MDFLFWGITLGVAGKIMLGLAVMMVHWRVVKEHKIDKRVISEMRRERNIALIGIILILVGYILEMLFFGYLPTPTGLEGFILGEPI